MSNADNGYWIAETRVSLDSVVHAFLNGESPESIAQNFPLLSLEQVYGGITFYLANRDLIDDYLAAGETEFDQLQQTCRQQSPAAISEPQGPLKPGKRKRHDPGALSGRC